MVEIVPIFQTIISDRLTVIDPFIERSCLSVDMVSPFYTLFEHQEISSFYSQN